MAQEELMITHGHDVYYGDGKCEYADFWVIRPDGVKWETCRAERGERNVIMPKVHGYWLDADWLDRYMHSLYAAAAWVREGRS
jgi:hypothetical protein